MHSSGISTGEAVLDAFNITKKFGELTALDGVTIRLKPGSIHALLGENGAGKSTLVKCIMGYYNPDEGQILVDGKEQSINQPKDAAALGIGMVYQHFTVINNMTVLENIVLARPALPSFIDWKKEAEVVSKKMQTMPFQFELDKQVSSLSAGEKQKLEIIKQLMLNIRVLILDEPTSVLTPNEADEILQEVKKLSQNNGLAVLIITHKFREVMGFADTVTVLRKGAFVGSQTVAETNPEILSEMMMGEGLDLPPLERDATQVNSNQAKLSLKNLSILDNDGLIAVDDLSLQIYPGEIVGIAGVSGNGQSELTAGLGGQRALKNGVIEVDGQTFSPVRRDLQKHRYFVLPEEPLKNACVGNMSVADNMALRNFDLAPNSWFNSFLNFSAIKRESKKLITAFNVKTPGPDEVISNLSGGNVQRAVLARELSQQVNVLVIANPCFGLDFKAVSDIRNLIMEARNEGAAVLLISEDLDEVLQLSDRFYVMSKGKVVLESKPNDVDLTEIGKAMAGHMEAAA